MERENRIFSSLCVRRMHTFRAETQPPDLIAARSGNKLISHIIWRIPSFSRPNKVIVLSLNAVNDSSLLNTISPTPSHSLHSPVYPVSAHLHILTISLLTVPLIPTPNPFLFTNCQLILNSSTHIPKYYSPISSIHYLIIILYYVFL